MNIFRNHIYIYISIFKSCKHKKIILNRSKTEIIYNEKKKVIKTIELYIIFMKS